MTTRTKLDLESLRLKAGSHSEGGGEYCVMEATAAYLGEPHSDHDVDQVCPRIEAYARALNDWLLSGRFAVVEQIENSDRLKAFIPRLPNTRGTAEQDERKRWMLQETATAVFAAEAMEAAGRMEQAAKLRVCRVTDAASSKETAAWAANAAEAAKAARAAKAAWAATAAWAAEAAKAAKAAEAAWAAWAAWAANAAEAAKAARAAKLRLRDAALDLLDRLIRVTEAKP